MQQGRLMTKKLAKIFLFSCIFLISAADAQHLHSKSDIQEKVQEYIAEHSQSSPSERISINVTPLNPKLKLTNCSEPLLIKPIHNQHTPGLKTLKVECKKPHAWKLYVNAKIHRYLKVLVASHSIMKGQPILASSVSQKTQNIAKLRGGYFTNINQLSGMSAKRTIRAGNIISPRYLKASNLVSRGQRVAIIAHTGNINVEVSGTAKEDGVLGKTISVLNRSTNKIVEARVIARGEVSIS